MFKGWGINADIADQQGGDPGPYLTKKEVGMKMLHFVYYLMRRSGLEGCPYVGSKSVKQHDIVLGCLSAVYEQGLQMDESLIPFGSDKL